MVDATRFKDMPVQWQPWDVPAGNTFDHYEQHLPGLRALAARLRS